MLVQEDVAADRVSVRVSQGHVGGPQPDRHRCCVKGFFEIPKGAIVFGDVARLLELVDVLEFEAQISRDA
jgi:hypothetical protein